MWKQRWLGRAGILGVLVGLVFGSVSSVVQVSASNIASFNTFFATNEVSAGTGGLRGVGSGQIVLGGVTGSVTKAFLYWQGPTNSTSPTANANITFNGNAITGANIGFSSDNCWGFLNSQAYRADVTKFVSGNGTYTLANMKNASADVNGASLVVFFDSGNPASKRDYVVFDGNDSNIQNPYDANGWNVTLNGINYTSGPASFELHVSDGQAFTDDALVLNSKTLVPTGPIFQGTSVPSSNPSSSATTNGGLWDIRSFDITSYLSPGVNNLSLTSGVAADCLSLVVAIVNLPAGAAPPTGDTVPPVTTATVTPAPNANGWNRTPVTVALTSTDSEPNGTGVKSITYSLTGAQTGGPTTVNGANASFTVSAQGITTISYFAVDNANQVEATKTLVVKIDTTSPEAYLSYNPGDNKIHLYGFDALSGLAGTNPLSPTSTTSGTWNTETGPVPVLFETFNLADNAGNTTTVWTIFTPDGLNASIQAVQYGSGPKLTPQQNILQVRSYVTEGKVTSLNQTVYIGNAWDQAQWFPSNNTTILQHVKPDPASQVTLPGMVLLQIWTNNGKVQLAHS